MVVSTNSQTITGAMSTINPAVELAQPQNKPSVQYIQDIASKPDFDFPPVGIFPVKIMRKSKLFRFPLSQSCLEYATRYWITFCVFFFSICYYLICWFWLIFIQLFHFSLNVLKWFICCEDVKWLPIKDMRTKKFFLNWRN